MLSRFHTCHIFDGSQPQLMESISKRAEGTWRLGVALGLSLFFMLAEIIAAYLSNSLALWSDSAHMLSDVSGFAISLIAARFVRPLPLSFPFPPHVDPLLILPPLSVLPFLHPVLSPSSTPSPPLPPRASTSTPPPPSDFTWCHAASPRGVRLRRTVSDSSGSKSWAPSAPSC